MSNSFRKISLLLILCLALSFFAGCRGLFFNPVKTFEKGIRLQPYDAVIVPGIPFEDSTWSYIMKGRVLWSVYLYRQGITKNIIYSGSSVYSPFIEGKIMALYAEQLGVPRKNIFVEPKAEHSTENVYYGCMIAIRQGFRRVALATDRFQSRTLADFLPKIKRKTRLDIQSLPMQDEMVRTMPPGDPVIEYNLAKVDSFVSLTVRESKLKRFWGTIGKHIKYERLKSQEKEKVNPTN